MFRTKPLAYVILDLEMTDAKSTDLIVRPVQFQEVNVVSLPDRTDKRDAFAVQAALSGILYTHVDGVDGSSVLSKALPYVRSLVRLIRNPD